MSTMAMFVSRARKKKKIKKSEIQKETLPQTELGEDSNLQQFVCRARRGQNRSSGLLLQKRSTLLVQSMRNDSLTCY